MSEVKKYELLEEEKINWCGKTLYRIRALIDFTLTSGDRVNKGDLGGYIEKEDNLSHSGNAWVYGNARVGSNDDYICIKGLGSYNRNTTFYKCKDGHIDVVCGCFRGNLNEFVAKVKDTHKNSKYAKEYLAAVEVVKIHFGL